MTTYIVSAGVTSTSLTLHSGDVLEVKSGGSAVDITVCSGGVEYVSSGGTAVSTTLNKSGYQLVYSDGEASFTSVNNGGIEFVSSGGSAVSTTLVSGGEQQVSSGGKASFTSARDGDVFVFSGGVAVSTTLTDGSYEQIDTGGSASFTSMSDGTLSIGGTAVDTTLTNDAFAIVSSGGSAISTTVNSGSYLWVSSGGTASFVTVSSGGTAKVFAGGSARFATVDSGGTETVSGTAISTTVNNGGFEDVSSGGRTSFTTVDSGGTENVFAGGTAISATVNGSGTAFVYAGGTTSFATVRGGASEYVYEGGRTVSTTVTSDGTEFVFPGGTASFTTVSSGGALDEPAATGSGGLAIDVSYDTSVADAPPGFKTTVAAAVAYLENLISTPITITIDVGFGEVSGTSLGPTDLGESESSGINVSYQTLRSALLAHAAATGDYAAAASLPTSDPTDGGSFYVSYAEAEALGLSSGPGAGDAVGAIGLSSSLPFTYGTTNAATPDTYDAFGVVEHEITEVMGRTEELGEFGTGFYTPLDLFRYASPGERDLTWASGWFSVDGTDLLAQFNDPSNGGDAADWASSVPNDAFDAFSQEGAVNPVSPTDLQVMDVIGYTPTVSEPSANTTATWLGAVSADWNTASDWNIGVAPDAGTIDVLISQPGIYVVAITAGESFTVGTVTLAGSSSASGALAISGTAASLTALGEMEVGAAGAGNLLIENQASVVTGSNTIALGFDVGVEAGASGAVTVTGTRSLLLNFGGVIVGDGGLGSLSIQSGATVVTVPGLVADPAAVIANTASADGSEANVTGSGSTWQVAGALDVGSAATGVLAITNGATVSAATLDAGVGSSGAGIVTVSGPDADLTTTGTVSIGDAGSGELSILDGANASIGGDLNIANSGTGTGNVDIEDTTGTITLGGNVWVGYNGFGVFNIGYNVTYIENNGGINFGPDSSGAINSFPDPSPYLSNSSSNPVSIGATGTDQLSAYLYNSGEFTIPANHALAFDTPIIYGGGSFSLASGDSLALNAGTVSGQTFTLGGDDTLTIGIDNLATIDLPDSGTGPFTAEANPDLGQPLLGNFGGVIANFADGDIIVVDIHPASASPAMLSQNGSIVSVTELVNGTIATLGTLTFDTAANAGAAYTDNAIQRQVVCFAAGTRIATARGEVAVEAIGVGERVRVLLGEAEGEAGGGFADVIWAGRREVDCTRHREPRKVWPVRVAAGAFGPGAPHADLFLSPDHAVYVEGVLIPVKYLVNGSSIAQVKVDNVTYHHIELAAHDVVLAEGLAVESFLDIKDGRNYPDRPGPVRLYPDYTARMWEAFGCARLVVTGPELAAARALVAGFAGEQQAA